MQCIFATFRENQVDSKELNELLEAACDRLGSVCNDMVIYYNITQY